MADVDFLEAQVRSLENENRALRQGLWDEYFKAVLPATVHHGKGFGVAVAANVANEALRVRLERFGVQK